MRQDISVLMLVVRSSIYKILAVLGVLAVLQMGFFYLAADTVRLERVIEISYMEQIFYIGFFLISLILMWAEGEKGSQWEYTLCRLGISRERVFFLWSGYNVCCFFLLFAVEILLAIGGGQLYLERMEVGNRSAQSLFLAFWRNDFLHSLLPLTEGSRWVRNGLLLAVVGMGIAYLGSEEQWNRKLPLLWGNILMMGMFSDAAMNGKWDLVKSGLLLIGIVLLLAGERRKYIEKRAAR